MVVDTHGHWLQWLEIILEYLQVAFRQSSYFLALVIPSTSRTSDSLTVALGDVLSKKRDRFVDSSARAFLLVKSWTG